MISFVNTLRIINVLHINLVHIHPGHSQLIMKKLSILMKTSLKKNISKKIILMSTNMIMIKKKIFIRQILKRIHFMNQSVTMIMSCLFWIYSRKFIILISFTHELRSLYMFAACTRPYFNQITSCISTFIWFMKKSKNLTLHN